MQKVRKRSFTYRLLIAYAAIIVVPIIILVFIAGFSLQNQQLDMIVRTANAELDETVGGIEAVSEAVARLETAVRMRTDLINYIASPETDWNSYDTIEKYINEIEEVQRELFLVTLVDNLHIFVFNESVPERWPVVLNSSRLGSIDYLEPWDYAKRDISLAFNDGNPTEYLVHTTPITHYGRKVGILQTLVSLDSFLSEITDLGSSGLQNDYAFQIIGDDARRIVPNDYSLDLDSIPSSVLEEAVEKAISTTTEEERGDIRIRRNFSVYEILYYYNQTLGLLFLKVCPTEQISNTYAIYTAGAILLIILIMGFIVAASYLTTKRNTRNLVMIMDAMSEVAKGNYDVSFPLAEENSSDVEDARVSLIALTGQLKDAIMEIKRKEEILADTQIRAMQNQINVHFIINTVESIKMQAMINEDYDVEHSLDLLGELFRYSLRWKERFVELSRELDYIQTYIELMNFRNDFSVSYINDVNPSCYSLRVPKMILQPIVENAFKYSFDLLGIDGTVIITSEDKGDRVDITLTNSGKQFSREKKEEVLEYLKEGTPEKTGRGSIGLKNIQQRLFMFYGPGYKIEIDNETEGWTHITVPIKKEVLSENLGS